MTDKMSRKEAKKILSMDASACSCDECNAMCKKRPCWPTPKEAEALMDAGHSNSLMYDYWGGSPITEEGICEVPIIGPAMVGCEGGEAPFFAIGGCTFFSDGKCSLHDQDLKPIEGRLAIHDEGDRGVHQAVAVQWESKEGARAVDRWQELMDEKWRKIVEKGKKKKRTMEEKKNAQG